MSYLMDTHDNNNDATRRVIQRHLAGGTAGNGMVKTGLGSNMEPFNTGVLSNMPNDFALRLH